MTSGSEHPLPNLTRLEFNSPLRRTAPRLFSPSADKIPEDLADPSHKLT
jgi:hypothetical protein